MFDLRIQRPTRVLGQLALSLGLLALASVAASVQAASSSPAATVAKAPAPVVSPVGNAFFTRFGDNDGAWMDYDSRTLRDWSDPSTVISSWVRVAQPGKLSVALKASLPQGGASTLRLSVNGKSVPIKLSAVPGPVASLASFDIAQAGYVRIDLQGVSRTGPEFAVVSGLELGGTAAPGLVYANDAENYYWSRRGPSVHLGFTTPANTEYFYSELTVPTGEDTLGSYFMTNGFNEGYMGVQVNGPNERWVLFSVWDPAVGSTTLLRKGPDVITNGFGGEGTGGQSHLVFPWVAGNTYKFITRARPDGQGATDYSAWFFAPELGQWRFIATWHRPNTNTWLKGAYSFLENFYDENGFAGRRALYGQQWAVSSTGVWTELNKARFTVDATGAAKQRMDFAGGLDASGKFYLRNGGFFNETVPANQNFTRPLTGMQPQVQLNTLP
ncbi:DUF3472 domain-containing protein [Paucibacter sp. APW11]|uniref:DUF3472 domain-containing protein n=1 Tax=Roseateles aquae TaxID=3077235 RepID=A0ABU3PBD8_9BURK|nr:DUF3472 domain-containing protein [Paucibacter sp. APW11]MDT8999086.1 DUF3472 domain-containing protein [Paucibacter sp. APW11]